MGTCNSSGGETTYRSDSREVKGPRSVPGTFWGIAIAVGALGAMPAQANMGLPMVAVFLPPLWLALLPIIAIETAVVARRTAKPAIPAAGAMALANIASTIIGVPLVWFTLAVVQALCCGTALGLESSLTKLYAVTVQSPWLLSYDGDFHWMIPAALLSMGLICLAMSVLVEAPIASRILGVGLNAMWRPVAWANIVSYVVLGGVGSLVAYGGMKLEALYELFFPLSKSLAEGVFIVVGWLAGQ